MPFDHRSTVQKLLILHTCMHRSIVAEKIPSESSPKSGHTTTRVGFPLLTRDGSKDIVSPHAIGGERTAERGQCRPLTPTNIELKRAYHVIGCNSSEKLTPFGR